MIEKFKDFNKNYFTFWYNKCPKKLQMLIDATKGVKQSNVWHLEGDVYIHIVLVVNRLAKTYNSINLILAGLFHDLGKTTTTKWNETKNDWVAPGHEDESVLIVDEFKDWIESEGGDFKTVREIVEHHMKIKFLDNFRLQNKMLFMESPYMEDILKFNSADYGGTDSGCKPIKDLTDIKNEIEEYRNKIGENEIISSKFNGMTVKNFDPTLKGEAIGKVIKGFKDFLENKYNTDYKEYILKTDKNTILDEFKNFYQNN